EVFENRSLEFGPASRYVNVLDAEQKLPAPDSRRIMRRDGREGMAEMEQARRTGREARDEAHRAFLALVLVCCRGRGSVDRPAIQLFKQLGGRQLAAFGLLADSRKLQRRFRQQCQF